MLARKSTIPYDPPRIDVCGLLSPNGKCRGRRLVISRIDSKTGDYFMNRLIVAALRCFLVLLVPVGAYALSAQLAAHGNKSAANPKPSHHVRRHSKRTAGRDIHSSPAMPTKHQAGGGAHIQHTQAHHHLLSRGRHQTGGTPTPTPTPTPETTPVPDLTDTPAPSPTS